MNTVGPIGDPGPCPVCVQGELEHLISLSGVPIMSTAFHRDRDAALAAPRGDLDLALCRTCSLVWNTAFDPSLVDYTPDYENSQHFSPAFRDYVADLARRLDERHGLRGRVIVEIGCGKGEFLALLTETARAHGLGFDPTFDGEVTDERIRVVRRYYDEDTAADVDAALVMARHVVEHLADPVTFLADVRRAGGDHAAHYYEVPNAEHVFTDRGMWDLIYQHVGYFTRPALDMTLRMAGYRVLSLDTSFHGQFLGIDAMPATPEDRDVAPPDVDEVSPVVDRITDFVPRFRERLAGWNEHLPTGNGDVALWGAGAKGVTFLNLLDDPGMVGHVVDVNPRKAGRHVPGTGHRIESPAALAGRRLRTVFIANPAYEHEIGAHLRELGCNAAVEAI